MYYVNGLTWQTNNEVEFLGLAFVFCTSLFRALRYVHFVMYMKSKLL